MTTRQISRTIEDIYGLKSATVWYQISQTAFSADRGLTETSIGRSISDSIHRCSTHFSVRDKGQIRKLAAYVILAVSMTGHKEVLSIHIGENESAKYWLGVLNELKNRGVKDVLVICADGLTGMKEAVSAAFPQTELQLDSIPLRSIPAG